MACQQIEPLAYDQLVTLFYNRFIILTYCLAFYDEFSLTLEDKEPTINYLMATNLTNDIGDTEIIVTTSHCSLSFGYKKML